MFQKQGLIPLQYGINQDGILYLSTDVIRITKRDPPEVSADVIRITKRDQPEVSTDVIRFTKRDPPEVRL